MGACSLQESHDKDQKTVVFFLPHCSFILNLSWSSRELLKANYNWQFNEFLLLSFVFLLR